MDYSDTVQKEAALVRAAFVPDGDDSGTVMVVDHFGPRHILMQIMDAVSMFSLDGFG